LSAEALAKAEAIQECICGKSLDCFVASLLAMTEPRISTGVK
jgi:hypothetical protein